jgi:hypothetical protein
MLLAVHHRRDPTSASAETANLCSSTELTSIDENKSYSDLFSQICGLEQQGTYRESFKELAAFSGSKG